MHVNRIVALAAATVLAFGCGGGGGAGSSGSFTLIEFLESGKDQIPRNRMMSFRFSRPVDASQDFSERLSIQNVQSGADANFAKAQGSYVVSGEQVRFVPRLPTKTDRSDAGFRADANYHVFLKGGPDALTAASGERIPVPEEFIFDTNEFFEDSDPSAPPRALTLRAVDPKTGTSQDLSRLDPRPFEQAQLDNAALVAAGNVIDPGNGTDFDTPWKFELVCTESIDPAALTADTIQMFEIRSGAFTEAPATAPPGHQGDVVQFRVPIKVGVEQGVDANGQMQVRITVQAIQTLVDNTRYRLSFSGQILGLDFRKTFSGDNGLTGDGETTVDGDVFPEDGGLGYVTEFLVFDRPGILASRTLQFDPLNDGIDPEEGQTARDENDLNSALYNPAASPGSAVGFLGAFGNGADGPLSATGGNTEILDTGDTPNEPLGNPFTVNDLNPDDDMLSDTRPGGPITYDSPTPFELELEALTISSSSTLRVIGTNPVLFRVAGIVQISGTLDIAGQAGGDAGGTSAGGGLSGAGGFAGADSRQGDAGNCSFRSTSCTDFVNYLNSCRQAAALFPASDNGTGPGRGLAGGEGYTSRTRDNKAIFGTSGGGGGSHARSGQAGEDRRNVGAPPGSSGPNCSVFVNVRLSGVVGVRGMPGPVYGDRNILDVNLGGSGGGSGGASHTERFGTNQQAGGAGGGGGGSVTIVAAGSILAIGGIIDASGGNGGRGAIRSSTTTQSWDAVTGGGGGGSGGSIALISGDTLDLSGAVVNTTGGSGGARANEGLTVSCNACNAGGDGGDGFIFLMDADGEIDGFSPSDAGEYDSDPRGVLTIQPFSTARFSSISAITELFPMTAANPRYVELDLDFDVVGNVNPDQVIRVVLSSAKSNREDPLLADPASELPGIVMAELTFSSGGTKVTKMGDMADLNEIAGSPDREAFVRVRSEFEYTNGVEAALGPFASMDEFTISYRFNE